MMEEIKRWKNYMDTVEETGIMKCNYCDTPIDVSDCSTYCQMVQKIVTTHVRREHPERCMTKEEARQIIENERKIDKDEYK